MVISDPPSREMALRGRVGAFARLAKHPASDLTAPARAAFLAKFERQVDPESKLPSAERARRAVYARKAHFARLSLASARARRARPQEALNAS